LKDHSAHGVLLLCTIGSRILFIKNCYQEDTEMVMSESLAHVSNFVVEVNG
jgi:hypothetical protein